MGGQVDRSISCKFSKSIIESSQLIPTIVIELAHWEITIIGLGDFMLIWFGRTLLLLLIIHLQKTLVCFTMEQFLLVFLEGFFFCSVAYITYLSYNRQWRPSLRTTSIHVNIINKMDGNFMVRWNFTNSFIPPNISRKIKLEFSHVIKFYGVSGDSTLP